jgi:hypothetical protein
MEEKTNSHIFLRPRFSLIIPQKQEVVLDIFITQKKTAPFLINILDSHVFIDIPKRKSHFWSPQLHFEVVQNGEDSSLIKGLFGPKPEVWTLFMFAHFILALLFLSGIIVYYVNASFDKSVFLASILLITAPLLWVLFYFLGKIGKKTGSKQMEALRNFMQQSLQEGH